MRILQTYPSKIMLAGEYGVIVGGSALTIPFRRFSARVRKSSDIPEGKSEEAERSRSYLGSLYKYIAQLEKGSFHAPPDLKLFSEQLDEYWLEMDIPNGYGLGSSGAVSAAVYDLFFPSNSALSLQNKKEDLAAIESFFHGKSSGVDALTCHSGTALHFLENGDIKALAFDASKIHGGYRFFLLDSGEPFDTGSLVQHFLESMKTQGFASSIRNEYLILNNKLIETLLETREADPAMLVRIISDYQFTHFSKMIPHAMLDDWIEGQVNNQYYLKLNGSGGGFMLGIAHEYSMESLEERWKDRIIWIE